MSLLNEFLKSADQYTYIFAAVIINNERRRLLLSITEQQTIHSKRAMTTVAVTGRGRERGLVFVLTWPREVAKSNQTR